VISPSECGGVLFVVLCGIVWFPILLRYSFDSYQKINYSIKDLGINVADPEAMGIPVTFILSYIFVGIMALYAINSDVVSLFADSSFTFLAVLNDVIHRFEWMNIVLLLSKKLYIFKNYLVYFWITWDNTMKEIKTRSFLSFIYRHMSFFSRYSYYGTNTN